MVQWQIPKWNSLSQHPPIPINLCQRLNMINFSDVSPTKKISPKILPQINQFLRRRPKAFHCGRRCFNRHQRLLAVLVWH
jgi:hypothetical protein